MRYCYVKETEYKLDYGNGHGVNYNYDQQGDVIAIVNKSGERVVEYTYDAWGNVLSITGTFDYNLGIHNPILYRGYIYDHETGLYYCQSRYYDPKVGRFINADTFTSTGQGILGNNMFAYCLNNPVRYVDIQGSVCADAYSETPGSEDDNPLNDARAGGSDFDPYQAIIDSTYTSTHGGQSKGFSSYAQLKSHIGSPGKGKQWHHIVEQNQTKKSGFSSESVNNTSNIISLDSTVHGQISGFYSSKQDYTGGQTVRNWLAAQSFDFQYQFGVKELARIMYGG